MRSLLVLAVLVSATLAQGVPADSASLWEALDRTIGEAGQIIPSWSSGSPIVRSDIRRARQLLDEAQGFLDTLQELGQGGEEFDATSWTVTVLWDELLPPFPIVTFVSATLRFGRAELCALPVGREAGVGIGRRFLVLRGHQIVGSVVVREVRAHSCVCSLDRSHAFGRLGVGDAIVH